MPLTRSKGDGLLKTATTAAANTPNTKISPVKIKTPSTSPSSTPVARQSTKNKRSRQSRVTKFPDRLVWKMSHLNMPTTSTPKHATENETNLTRVTKRDVETAFGFDDSGEDVGGKDYSTLISPIAHASPKSIIPPPPPPFWKAQPLVQRNAECDTNPSSLRAKYPKEDCIEKEAIVSSASSKAIIDVESAIIVNEDQSTIVIDEPEAKSGSVSIEPIKKRLRPLKIIQQQKQSRRTVKSKLEPKKTLQSRKETLVSEKNSDGPSPFSQLLERYHDDDDTDRNEQCDLHIDPNKIVRTYSSRKRVKFSEDRETELEFAARSNTIASKVNNHGKLRPRVSHATHRNKRTKKAVEELDDKTRRWLEEKNKEFEDVLKVPLVIERSFSE